jgi:CheY-like chemotaxis protein
MLSATVTPRHILLVEDDQDLRELVHETLEADGYAVTAARNGAEAMALLRAHTTFDLMLIDLMMPVMDGHEVLAALARDPTAAPARIIVFSAQQDRVRSLPMPVAAVIVKPVMIGRLLETVRDVIES